MNYRLSKDTTERYESFAALREAFGSEPVSKQTKDKQKLAKQKDNFVKKHVCKACRQPMTYFGGNQMACTNPSCKGIKYERIDKETGEKKAFYANSFELLDAKGASIAQNIFA